MRFLLGVFVGYNLRGRNKLLMVVLTIVLLIDYVMPTGALVALRLDVQRERQSRPARTKVPSIKRLSYEEAETRLHASKLNIRLLATRYDLPLQPRLIIDQVPQPGDPLIRGGSRQRIAGTKPRTNAAISSAAVSSAKWPASNTCTSALGTSSR